MVPYIKRAKITFVVRKPKSRVKIFILFYFSVCVVKAATIIHNLRHFKLSYYHGSLNIAW